MNSLKEVFDKAERIVIVGHFNPDGDAVGSAMSLHQYLLKLGKEANVIFPNAIPRNLAWMDTQNICLNYMSDYPIATKVLSEADCIISVDFHSPDRLASMQQAMTASTAKKVLIDHHVDADKSTYDVTYADTTVSSTCELIYRIIRDEMDLNLIDKEIASYLYAGLCTDTGSFRYSCLHKELYLTVADLIKRGLDTVEVHHSIFDTFTEERMRMLGFCFNKNLVMKKEYNTAYMYLDKDILEKYDYRLGDLEGVVNYALSIENVKFVAFFTEHESRIRASFRSKGNIDANEFAKKYFNGGGHKNSAGGSAFGTLEETLRNFESVLPDFYETQIKGVEV